MRELLFILSIILSSCVIPQHIDSEKCCDKHTYYYKPYYQPTRVIVIKKNKPLIRKKRHIKVKINKHRKIK